MGTTRPVPSKTGPLIMPNKVVTVNKRPQLDNLMSQCGSSSVCPCPSCFVPIGCAAFHGFEPSLQALQGSSSLGTQAMWGDSACSLLPEGLLSSTATFIDVR